MHNVTFLTPILDAFGWDYLLDVDTYIAKWGDSATTDILALVDHGLADFTNDRADFLRLTREGISAFWQRPDALKAESYEDPIDALYGWTDL